MVMLQGFDVVVLRLRKHSLKVKKEQIRLDLHTFTFGQRVMNMWYDVPADVFTFSIVRAFKNQLASHLKKNSHCPNIVVLLYYMHLFA